MTVELKCPKCGRITAFEDFQCRQVGQCLCGCCMQSLDRTLVDGWWYFLNQTAEFWVPEEGEDKLLPARGYGVFVHEELEVVT